MDDLLQFLRARLDEDERVARAATEGPWWYNPGKQWLGPEAFEKYDLRQGEEFVGYGGPHPFTGAVCATGPANNMQSMQDAEHIARHDPARVLAEVEAKRRIIEEHKPAVPKGRPNRERGCLTCTTAQEWDAAANEANCLTLRLLASPYADRPGYREEWRP